MLMSEMTDSTATVRGGKRHRLIASAADLLHRQGASATTLAQVAAQSLSLLLDWAEDQFRQMGRRDARDLAIAFFAAVQGAALLANAFRDPDIMTSHVRQLERWIDALA